MLLWFELNASISHVKRGREKANDKLTQ